MCVCGFPGPPSFFHSHAISHSRMSRGLIQSIHCVFWTSWDTLHRFCLMLSPAMCQPLPLPGLKWRFRELKPFSVAQPVAYRAGVSPQGCKARCALCLHHTLSWQLPEILCEAESPRHNSLCCRCHCQVDPRQGKRRRV